MNVRTRNRSRRALLALLAAPLAGCGDGRDTTTFDLTRSTGALIRVRMESTTGVLLDELPTAHRDRAALALAEREELWLERARAQIRLASYRMVFRNFFYDDKGQLPLPPEPTWQVELLGAPERQTIGGHDVLAVRYRMTGVLLTDEQSPAAAEPALAEVGGRWAERLVFPLDPELLFQRTGYACMDESEFPPNSVDGENVATFYDQECEGGENDCHVTGVTDESCIEALERAVGAIETDIEFERVEWDPKLAAEVRYEPITSPESPDIAVIGEGLDVQRVIYRYIPPDSCALVEGCVGAPGFRRLLQFDASVKNLGGEALHIGDVDYFLEGSGTPLSDANVFVFSSCHEHYHFSHYGDFSFDAQGAALSNKQAFCLQSTNRYSNDERSPLTHAYGGCDHQGIEAGWGDDYGAGIECQWIDVTDVAPEGMRISGTVGFQFNPDQVLCEGEVARDDMGNFVLEPTDLTTADGETVQRPVCELAEGWDANNYAERPVDSALGGLVTSPCRPGRIGPLRDCGFGEGAGALTTAECAAGASITLRCTLADDAAPAVVRVCEYSHVLASGVPCTYREALGNFVVAQAAAELTVACPAARDEREPGGIVALYSAPLLPDDALAGLTCDLVTTD